MNDLHMSRTLIVDIETVGEKWDAMDEFTQDNLTSWIRKESRSEEDYEAALGALQDGLGFSPLTGQIVAIGVLDYETDKRTVYYQDPAKEGAHEEEGVKYEAMSEAKMLHTFWEMAQRYTIFVTFNGYQFDIPYLMIRAAVHGVRPTVNLMTNRYLSLQRGGVSHIDLIDQLSFYGAMRRKGSLHMWTRAFGIASPKSADANGHAVADMFESGRHLDIARYNAADLRATAELYTRWLHVLKI